MQPILAMRPTIWSATPTRPLWKFR